MHSSCCAQIFHGFKHSNRLEFRAMNRLKQVASHVKPAACHSQGAVHVAIFQYQNNKKNTESLPQRVDGSGQDEVVVTLIAAGNSGVVPRHTLWHRFMFSCSVFASLWMGFHWLRPCLCGFNQWQHSWPQPEF